MKILHNIWDWTCGQLVGEVPKEDAVCAFDCRKPQCTEGEWEGCSRRLESVAQQSRHAKRSAYGAATNYALANNVIPMEPTGFELRCLEKTELLPR